MMNDYFKEKINGQLLHKISHKKIKEVFFTIT